MAWQFPQHLLRTEDLGHASLTTLLDEAARLKEYAYNRVMRGKLKKVMGHRYDPLRCHLLYTDASNKLTLSLGDATRVLGGAFEKDLFQFSSQYPEGATYEHTACLFGAARAALIVRHDQDTHAAKKIADIIDERRLECRVFNGGCGRGSERIHPVQTLTDLFTIRERKPYALYSGTQVYALVGDYENRILWSLIASLRHFGGTVYLIGPQCEAIHPELRAMVQRTALELETAPRPSDIAPLVDVWYFTSLRDYAREHNLKLQQEKELAGFYGPNVMVRRLMKKDAIVLNPLPADQEVRPGLDLQDQRFIHHDQALNTTYAWMAVLKCFLAPQVSLDERHTVAIEPGTIHHRPSPAQHIPRRDVIAACTRDECPNIKILSGGKLNEYWVRMDGSAQLEKEFRRGLPALPCHQHEK